MNKSSFKKVPEADRDYILLYAEELNKNPKEIFHQQKILINSQIISSRSFFQNLFKGKNFKLEARKYLRERKIIK
jgi:hypothetical protein